MTKDREALQDYLEQTSVIFTQEVTEEQETS